MSPTEAASPRAGSELDRFAGALYCGVLLFTFLLSAELLRLVLGERPRLILTLAQVLGLLVPALALTRAFASAGRPPATSRRPPPSGPALGLALPGLALGGFLFSGAVHQAWLQALASTGWAWTETWHRLLTESYGALLHAEGPVELAAVLLMVSLVPAVCEEVAFRRGLQGLLASRVSGPTAILVASAVFSAFHLDPFGLPARFLLGVSLGVVYHRTGALWTAGLLHAVHNVAIVSGLFLAGDEALANPTSLEALDQVSSGALVAIGLAGFALWSASAWLLSPRPGVSADEAEPAPGRLP